MKVAVIPFSAVILLVVVLKENFFELIIKQLVLSSFQNASKCLLIYLHFTKVEDD